MYQTVNSVPSNLETQILQIETNMADQENECTALKIKIDNLKKENESLKKETANFFDNVKEVFEDYIKSTIEAVLNRLTNEQNLLRAR